VPAASTKIITFDDSMIDPGCCSGLLCSHDYAIDFVRLFRQIASNPVGRILLYRLLIEIRRQNNNRNDAVEQGIARNMHQDGAINDQRKNCRMSQVEYDTNGWSWTSLSSTICFSNNPKQKVSTVVSDGTFTALRKRELCIALFHEMLHWYHYLRDPARADIENHVIHGNNNSILRFYFFNINPNTPGNTWGMGNDVKVEEIRTILGVIPDINGQDGQPIVGFLNGDDLSENLFRCALNYQNIQNILNKSARVYMRYGEGGPVDNTFANQISLAHSVTRTSINQIIPIVAGAVGPMGYWVFTEGSAIAP
ncbi:MAG: hypothetical protein LBD36_02775, partial [Holosporales bacterium]|nr:hypothetical protein [Holosporales bacterium]